VFYFSHAKECFVLFFFFFFFFKFVFIFSKHDVQGTAISFGNDGPISREDGTLSLNSLQNRWRSSVALGAFDAVANVGVGAVSQGGLVYVTASATIHVYDLASGTHQWSFDVSTEGKCVLFRKTRKKKTVFLRAGGCDKQCTATAWS